MPYINLRVSSPVSQAQRERLFAHTTRLMNEVMGKKPEVTVVQIQASGADTWSLNGEGLSPTDPVAAYVEIKVTLGTNSEEEKADMIAAMYALLAETLETVQQACYVVIIDVPASAWGYAGQTQAARAAQVN